MPPAFLQSASVFAVLTSLAKAGPVTATARATIERSVFIALLHIAALQKPVHEAYSISGPAKSETPAPESHHTLPKGKPPGKRGGAVPTRPGAKFSASM